MQVVCFGDSNTYGYDPRSFLGGRYDKDSRWVDLLASRTGWNVLNLGENGRCIPWGPVTLPAGTDLLIVMLGTNDLLQGGTPEQTVARMEGFLQRLALCPDQILLVAPPPMTFGEWVTEEEMIRASRTLARAYQALAKRLGIRFADAGAWGVTLAYDGVHFTGQGHRAFADGLYRVVSRFGTFVYKKSEVTQMEFRQEPGRIFACGETGNLLAEVTFPEQNGVAVINHTFVDDSLRGQGVAGQLLQAVADTLRQQGRKARPTCSYAVHWFETHPDQRDLLV